MDVCLWLGAEEGVCTITHTTTEKKTAATAFTTTRKGLAPMKRGGNAVRLVLLALVVTVMVSFFAPHAMAQDVKMEQSMELDVKTFHGVVDNPSKHVFVLFYAPWCGHCHRLIPKWEELAAEVKEMKDVVIAHIDASKHSEIGGEYNVRGFPTLRLFTKGNKEGLPYQGPRDVSALRSFLKSAI
ncbi:protein disulfide isomerase [Trypanosoma rangeli]|uniref:Protein disulfide isomerase n=1 Tax=Trypanosoma rangeli TaxID=5698 RepID=A0A3R7NHA8_TRYRA|nr:protein disulfide isomerase [Trypanosoma rangeli]RNF06550.1 protein disulfide isomerase [Trypanosoma rangeli]|eukprot:RNF06550.1 protein disulfide isomerase [Trypanosoma rangeli]